jgi:hypothetical protein
MRGKFLDFAACSTRHSWRRTNQGALCIREFAGYGCRGYTADNRNPRVGRGALWSWTGVWWSSFDVTADPPWSPVRRLSTLAYSENRTHAPANSGVQVWVSRSWIFGLGGVIRAFSGHAVLFFGLEVDHVERLIIDDEDPGCFRHGPSSLASSTSSIASRNNLILIGFDKWRSKPTTSIRSRSSGMADSVTAITGIASVTGSLRRR